MTAGTLHIMHAGAAVVTDLGRRRGPRFGVPSGGALDQRSAAIANVLVGNEPGAPLIEITALDLEFRTDVDLLLSVTGARVDVLVDGSRHPMDEPVSVQAGQTIALTRVRQGLRSYVAVHGSFEVPSLLGSCAPDTVLGFGSRLAEGERLVVHASVPPILNPVFSAALYRLGSALSPRAHTAVIDITDGPDVAEFGDTARVILGTPYTVGPASNHIGLRLAGPMPRRIVSGEVLSRGVPVGAIEAPPGDELLVLHRGRGVTAGYPVLGVVSATGLDALGQRRPGDTVRFRRVTPQHAVASSRADAALLLDLRQRVATVFHALGHPLRSLSERNSHDLR